MRKIRQNLLVASGDQSVFPSGQSVFNSDGTTAVKHGQLVVWDPATAMSLGATITCDDYDKIVISVGYKNRLRSCFGDVLHGCDVRALNAQAPACGVQDIWDINFDDVLCNDSVEVIVDVVDDDTLNTYPWNKTERYPFTIPTKDCVCTSCESGFDAKKLACKIVDTINSGGYNDLSPTRKAYFNKIPALTGGKFTAHVLWGGSNSNVVYCINPVSGACGDCLDADVLIKSFKYNDDQIITFTTTDNEDGDATLVEKLQTIVNAINAELGKNGSASLTKGSGECCSWRLEINTCFGDGRLYSDLAATAAISPCVAGNDPLDEIEITDDCPNCGEAATKTFAAGVRLIASPFELTCDPNAPAPNPVKGVGLRKLRVFTPKGFPCGAVEIIHVQEAAAPENLGYHFQWKDFASAFGGDGRGHEPFVRQGYGPLGLPLGRGREGAVAPKCKESYCSYAIEHAIPHVDQTVYGNQMHVRGTTIVIIPSGDTTTRTEFEAIINNYLPSCYCPVKSAVTCA